MNKYKESLDFLKEQLKLKYKVKEIHIAEIVAESFGDLQELIDKENPMKPIFDGSGYSDCDKVQYICPKCNQIMSRQVCITKHKPNYCYKCGQRLDWRENYE